MQYVSRPHHYIGNRRQENNGLGRIGVSGQISSRTENVCDPILYPSTSRPMTNFADRTIWTGDNLDILRGLDPALVDLIYLDPPLNSNRNYAAPVGSPAAGAFKDTWMLSRWGR